MSWKLKKKALALLPRAGDRLPGLGRASDRLVYQHLRRRNVDLGFQTIYRT